jgi:mono/diheme cytochrome c family protein
MKNQFKFTAGLTLALILGLSQGWCDDLAPGKKLFETKCAQCHGKDAKGVPNLYKVMKLDPSLLDLTRADAVKMTDEKTTATVMNGNKKMPKFKAKLTGDEIKSVVRYLRTLQPTSAVPAGKDTPAAKKNKNKKK